MPVQAFPIFVKEMMPSFPKGQTVSVRMQEITKMWKVRDLTYGTGSSAVSVAAATKHADAPMGSCSSSYHCCFCGCCYNPYCCHDSEHSFSDSHLSATCFELPSVSRFRCNLSA